MLSIYVSNKIDGGIAVYQGAEWHIGESKPIIQGAVYSIQADGHELEYIYKNFGNIPMRFNKPVILYHNPYAQFIWNNL